MHDCRKFRDQLLDTGADFAQNGQRNFCPDCRRFQEELQVLCHAMDAAAQVVYDQPEGHPEEYWTAFNEKLKLRIQSAAQANAARGLGWRHNPPRWAGLAVACLLLAAVTAAGLNAARRTANVHDARVVSGAAADTERMESIIDLDSSVVDFLGQSELFLRTFTKIEPADISDIEDARHRATRQLARISESKAAATDFLPVEMALDEYESVLREIKNLDPHEGIADIQDRIRRNGLIASLKVYQPRTVLVSGR